MLTWWSDPEAHPSLAHDHLPVPHFPVANWPGLGNTPEGSGEWGRAEHKMRTFGGEDSGLHPGCGSGSETVCLSNFTGLYSKKDGFYTLILK